LSLSVGDKRRLGGRFVVEREVGRGAVGVVYRAYDLETNSVVALKVIGSEAGVAQEDERRLAQEGRLLSELDHPFIVKTVAFGVLEDSGGTPFVAMEWLDGEDLAARQRRQPLTIEQAVRLAIMVGEALEAAHASGVIHRDIKPGNIFLCRNEFSAPEQVDFYPKLVDFGVAASSELRWTRAGEVVGTPAYMAPEQARADARVDARCDIYSLGATLFEVIAGRPPHVGPSAIATLARLVTTPAPRLSQLRRGVPVELDNLVHRMLQTEPDYRPSYAQDVVRELREALRDVQRHSWGSSTSDEPPPSRLGSSATRLVTSIVAIRFESPTARERAIEQLRQRGADAVPLGHDALVAHLGARRAVGGEAVVALDLGRRLARMGARVGIATGRVRVSWSSRSNDVHPAGEVVDRASALARDATAGTVLADATTSELGRGRYEFRTRDDGSSAVVGEQLRGTRERAGGAPFVGREPELAQVLSAFQRCQKDTNPILVTVTGPPGIGKSRLRREVLARISAQASAPQIVLQRSDAYARGHALGAAADVIRAIITLPKGATVQEAERAIVSRLGPATRDELTARNRELLARLLVNEALPDGLDPRGLRDVLWLAMTDLVLQVVLHEPVVIVMEDVQWADQESVGFIDHMLGRAEHRPLLVFALVRPAFWNDHPERFAGRDHVRLELRPISKRAARTIARALLGESAAETTLDKIAEQAAGLPLFAEELARVTVAGGDATRAATIESAIQVSLDALDDECRDALGRLSVFGQTCWDAGLEALGMHGAEGLMKELGAADVLVEQNVSRFPGTREWLFKHALVQEVAYSSLEERARKELHGLAASWLASMGEDAAIVARHFDLGDAQVRAAEHWARAAQRALATNALSDALRMADRALCFAEDKPTGFQRASYMDEAYSRLDPRASDRETAISALEENVYDEASAARARGARARYDDARGSGERISDRLAQTRDEAAALGIHDEEARCSAALAMRLAFAGRFVEAEAEAERLLSLSERRGIAAAAVDAYQTLAIIRQTQGALGAALDDRRNAADAARRAGLKEREAMLMTNLGFALTTIGARQESRSAVLTGLSLADAIGSTGAVRHAQMNLLAWSATFGNDKQLEPHLAAAREDADASASGIWAAPDRANLGVLFYRGCELLRSSSEAMTTRARSLLKIAAETYRATGNQDVLSVALGTWAEAERRCGNPSRAIEIAREAALLLENGAPSLLNESTVYLALHDANVEVGDHDAARSSVARGIPRLLRRLHGLVGTRYARLFLTELPQNVGLLAAAEGYGLVPDEIHRVLEGPAHH
jgi:hypothetical protein